jgi:hypothetical protein
MAEGPAQQEPASSASGTTQAVTQAPASSPATTSPEQWELES